ncbi:ankyrin repeat domain-containing protein 16-like [Physella acuta]|uniref:ankyrin repeat domain-containing protein 16-like n=1 Tax=Physella acuta TaxID=109671 RepID=UPI0027DC52B6|nr:ankyrin repeat domain-containing protein 16-like [Physella acuta]
MNFQTIQKAVRNDDVQLFSHFSETESRSRSNLFSHIHKKTGDTIVHIACRYGSHKILKYVRESDKNYVRLFEVCNNDGKRPLHDAAQYSHPNCLQILLESKVQVDSLKKGDWTPLMLACTKSSTEVIRMLVEAGANQYLKNKDGWNAFHIACREGHLSILKCLLEAASDSWNTKSKNLRSPLHTAALRGKTEVVKHLVCLYKTDEEDSCGITPLMDALRGGHVDTALVLIDLHGADLTKEDKVGRQAIHHIAQSGQILALHQVTERGISVNTKSGISGEMPLHTAAKEGQIEMGKKLLILGADINAVDLNGRTALHYASAGQQSEFVKLLLIQGAQLLADKNNQFPPQLAKKQNVLDAFGIT